MEGNQNYPLLLLTLLEKSQDNVIRVCAAVTFKNYIKRNWRVVSFTKYQQVFRIHSAIPGILYLGIFYCFSTKCEENHCISLGLSTALTSYFCVMLF